MFCGDLLQNTKKPAKNAMIVDDDAFDTRIEKLKQLKINTVYLGHGKPFKMEQFIKIRISSKG